MCAVNSDGDMNRAPTSSAGSVIGLSGGATLGQYVAVDNLGAAVLASNGGPTQTIALLPGSLAINAGSGGTIAAGYPTVLIGD